MSEQTAHLHPMTFSTSRADQPADGRRELSAGARSVLRSALFVNGAGALAHAENRRNSSGAEANRA